MTTTTQTSDTDLLLNEAREILELDGVPAENNRVGSTQIESNVAGEPGGLAGRSRRVLSSESVHGFRTAYPSGKERVAPGL